MKPPLKLSHEDSELLGLQDRFLRGFSWLRKVAGLTQSEVAESAGWEQPYVSRLEDAESPLIGSLSRVERYANACRSTAVLVFVDPSSGKVQRSMALGETGVQLEEAARESVESVTMSSPRLSTVQIDWQGAGLDRA